MDTRRILKWIALIMIMLLALSCKISFGDDEEDEGELRLQLTQQALQLTQVALAKPQDTPVQPTPTTETSDSSSGEVSVSATATDSSTPCNRSKFVSETISDYTTYAPGTAFEKTWTVRNEGTCTWNTNYTFRFTQGTRMNGASSQNLPNQVRPNETITMKVNLTAPTDPGTYTGRWEFYDDDGKPFGWYTVVIVVPGAGPAPGFFAVTSVEFYMPHTSIDTGCPNDINIKAEITSSAAGTVTYRWTDTAGGASGTQSVTFAGAEKKIVDYNTANITATGDYSASLYIDNPNHQWFGPKNFHVNCTP